MSDWLSGVTHEAFHVNWKRGLRTGPRLKHELPEVLRPGPRSPRLRRPPTYSSPDLLQYALEEDSNSLLSRQASNAPPSLRLKPLPLTLHKEHQFLRHTLDSGADAAELRTSFRKQMRRKYRSTLGCWRILDPAGHGRACFANVCKAAQQLGFINNCRPLWEALDADRDGFVTIGDFDPQLAEHLRQFAAAARRDSGTAGAAWQRHFNPGGLAKVSAFEFSSAVEAIGFDGDVDAVYAGLSENGHLLGVRGSDFALLDLWFKPKLAGSWQYAGPTRGVTAPPLRQATATEGTQPDLMRGLTI